ncbi:MAG: DUF167 domain-containing protein [Planctomycetota bacterium]
MDQPAIRDRAEEGATLKVRVSPGARKEGITGLFGDALKLQVREAPDRGKANRAVERLLASALETKASSVRVVRGRASREKLVLFRDLDAAVVAERVEKILVTLGAR